MSNKPANRKMTDSWPRQLSCLHAHKKLVYLIKEPGSRPLEMAGERPER